MKVILTKDHPDLGSQGSVVEVSDGYARNYLVPRGFAKEATASALRILEQSKTVWKKKEDQELAEATKLAASLAGTKLVIIAEAGESGKLYGSVTNMAIVEALANQHQVAVDKRQVLLVDPIRSLGNHTVPLKLHHELTVQLELEVRPKESPKPKEEAKTAE